MQTDQWRVVSDQYSCPVVMRGSDKEDDLEIVAKCYGIEGHSAESIAALVAAAPDLLAALKQAVSAITYLLSNDDDDPGYADTLNTLAAAIAKAEGRPS